MEELRMHEVFEIETLERLNSHKLLDPLVFGGGTMLRLCYGLDRYSVDLDFWLLNAVDEKSFLGQLEDCLGGRYEITDSWIKRNTILLEIRSANYPKLLKIEVRRGVVDCDWQDRIAFSKYDERQVRLKTHTLDYTMKKKIDAALNRKEIRDCFDIEFLIKQGIDLPAQKESIAKLKRLVGSFKKKDFKVSLGSYLDEAARRYYSENGFALLEAKINSTLSSI